MKKIIISMVAGLLVIGLGSGAFLIYSQGKADGETTNISEDMDTVDRSGEEPVSEDTLVYKDIEVAYKLPDNFYFQNEYSDLEHGNTKDYMDHNFNVMIDTYIYENYVGDIGLIGDTVEESYVYHDITIDANEWIREMEMVYLDTDDAAQIKEIQFGTNEIKYIIDYFKNDDGIMQGTMCAVTPIDDTRYYCTRVVEFDKDSAPDINNYEGVVNISIK